MPEPKAKIIDGESFQISQPYEAGHVCTDAEAKALNQTRSENIGNNLRTLIKEAKEKRDGGDPSDFDNLAAAVAEYDAKYNFSMGGGGGSTRKMDPVEREARSLATEYVKSVLAEKGRTPKQVPEGLTEEEWKEKLEANIEKVAASDDILKLAKRRVAEKQKVRSSLAGLLDE